MHTSNNNNSHIKKEVHFDGIFEIFCIDASKSMWQSLSPVPVFNTIFGEKKIEIVRKISGIDVFKSNPLFKIKERRK